MADKCNYFFRQAVTEAELDLGFELLEQADRDLAADLGIYGIVSGADPVQHTPVADLTIDLTAPGRSYDRLGQRIFFGSEQRVDCSIDHTGIPTDVATAGNERWLGVFLKFDRLESDPRTDGNSQLVYFRQDESFQLIVRQGAEEVIGAATKVPLEEDELLVCDVRRTAGQTQIFDPDIDTSRRQSFVFATGDALEITSSLWNVLQPSVDTVQAAFDSADEVLDNHFNGTDDRHPAGDIDSTPHGFIGADNVDAALTEIADDLASTNPAGPGASLVGADAVTGTPNALPPGHVGSQLAQLLTWINEHLNVSSGAHNASAVAASAHNYISGANVQAQLQEIVDDIESSSSGAAGASRVGADVVAGSPHALSSGTVDSQLATLLSYLNNHLTDSSDVHDASAISVEDTTAKLDATDVEDALEEIVNGFQNDHYRRNETNAGMHRTITQPVLGSGRFLIFDSEGIGDERTRLRVYVDAQTVWFVVNAYWVGTEWRRPSTSYYAGGFRFSRNVFEIFTYDGPGTQWTTWSRTFHLNTTTTYNSCFSTTGTIREIGKCGAIATNVGFGSKNLAIGGSVTFRNRFPGTPSSVTFTTESSSTTSLPGISHLSRDGFHFFGAQTIGANLSVSWFGTYDAIA